MAKSNQHFLTVSQRVFMRLRCAVIHQIQKQKIEQFFRLRFHLGHWKRRDIWGSDEILAV